MLACWLLGFGSSIPRILLIKVYILAGRDLGELFDDYRLIPHLGLPYLAL